jgi:hypothetical protein
MKEGQKNILPDRGQLDGGQEQPSSGNIRKGIG